jgi:hypothetical protein
MSKQGKSGTKPKRGKGKSKRSSYQVYLSKFKAKTGKGKGSAKTQYKKYVAKWNGKPAKSKSKGKGKGKGKGKSKHGKGKGKSKHGRGKGKSKAREEMAAEKGKSSKGKGKGKGKGKSKGKSGKRKKPVDLVSLITRNRNAIASVEARYTAKLAAMKDKLQRAEGAEKDRLIKKQAKLLKERDDELARIRKQGEKRLKHEQELQAAAAEGKKKKRKKGKSKREKNPIGSGGMQEYAAVGGGVLTAIALTIIPYRMIRSHALASGQDAPAQGDVPNLLTGQLPLWSRLKWKGAIALGVVLVGDIALPLFVASRIKTSDGWKTFFQLWGWTSVALAGSKLVVDTLALATKNTSLGQRLFAPENTARDVRTMSAAAQLPAIAVAPGTGLPGLTGYGKPNDPNRHTGAAGCGCGDCEAKRKLANPAQPGTNQPIAGTTPMPAQPGAVQPPGGNPLNPNTVVTGLPGNGVTAPGAAGAAGAPGTVTPINKFQPKNRFDGKSRFGAQ